MTTRQANVDYLGDMFRKILAEPDPLKARAMLADMTATLQQRYFYGVEQECQDAVHMLMDDIKAKEQGLIKEPS